ncbi:MAG TPA: MdtA/MuxA family multidrug efflux RND transporter periplasmic adaptor subunit [Burkholderiaceae bacterium]|nr:MdtA/MuxA family multidrug efflux RND transporter periplasmic adaptor subunit [Burkholderiaceae bacterium]
MFLQDPTSPRSRRARLLGWLVILCAVGAAAYWYFGVRGSGGPASSPAAMSGFGPAAFRNLPVPVRVATARQETLQHSLRAIGTVTAFNTVVVRSRVAGELMQLYFEEGQMVEAGEPLALIDPREYQVALDQALGQQQQNAAQLESARRDLERYRLLQRQNSIARQQVEQQEALVKQLEGTRVSDQAAVDSAGLQLSYTRIVAPISGRLGLRKVDQGNFVSASDADGLVTITQTQPISVEFTLPQADVADVLEQLREGRKLEVVLRDQNDVQELARGELMSLDNQIDVATGTLRLKARFANEDGRLFPNQFVNVILLVSRQEALAVPTAAVQVGSIGSFVYRVDDEGKAHIQRIVTGRVDGALTAVVEGLEAGQRVVVEGTDRLRDGGLVDVVSIDGQEVAARQAARSNGEGGGRRGAAAAAH